MLNPLSLSDTPGRRLVFMIFKSRVKRSNYTNALEFLSRKHPSLHHSSCFPVVYREIKPHANTNSKNRHENVGIYVVHCSSFHIFIDFVTPLRLTYAATPHCNGTISRLWHLEMPMKSIQINGPARRHLIRLLDDYDREVSRDR
jgi:hypothetical protein